MPCSPGVSVLPKKSALTDYSYRLGHDHQQRFLAALDQKMIGAGLATAQDAIFDLDFHAVMHWGTDPVLEKHYVPTRSQRSRSVWSRRRNRLRVPLVSLLRAGDGEVGGGEHREVICRYQGW